jgi:hypothetical protein
VWPDIGDDIWYSVRGSRKSGWVSIPVDVNFVYDVLLLEGYQDPAKPSEPPVLLRSAYVRTLPIHEGQNESNVTYQRVLVQPDNATDNEAGLRVFLTADGGVRPNYHSGELMLYLPKNPVPAQNPRVTMAIDGIAPLIMAKNSADSAALINPNTAPDFKKLNGVTFTEFFTSDSKMTREELRVVGEESRIYPAWHHGAEDENLDSGDVDGRALATWKIEPSSSGVPFLPSSDGKTSLFFDVYYYAFSVTPADDPATVVFKRWAIRNGLDNVNTDKESGVAGYTNTGGMVTVVIGTGGASGGTIWTPGSGGATYLFSRPPALAATVGPANQAGTSIVTYTVVPSDPPADSYKLYWTRTDDDGEPYSNLSVWNEAAVQNGTFPVDGAQDGRYTLVVQAIKDKYTPIYSSKIRKASITLRIEVDGSELGGGLWDFTPATGIFNLNENEEYRIVSNSGGSQDRKIHVAPGLGSVTLIMGEGAAPADIILTGVPALEIGAGSAVTIKLSDGITVKLGSGAGGPGVLVPQTASLTIETMGTLGNGALHAYGANNYPVIGGSGPSANSGEITINGGNIYANGGSGAAALGSGNGLVQLTGGRVSVQLAGGTAIGHNNQGSVQLNGGAILTVSGTGSPFSLGASGSQLNGGVVQVIQGNTNTTIYGSLTLPNVLFTNNALTVGKSDTLTVSGASTNAAPTPAAGVTVTIPSTRKVINEGRITVGAGTLSGTLDNNAANRVAGRVTVDGGTLSGTLTNTGIITMTGGTLSGTVNNTDGWINTTIATNIGGVTGVTSDLSVCGGIVFVDNIGRVRQTGITTLGFDATIEPTKTLNVFSGVLLTNATGTELLNRGIIKLAGNILGNSVVEILTGGTAVTFDNRNGVIFAQNSVADGLSFGGGILFSSNGEGRVVGNDTTLGDGLDLSIPAGSTLTILSPTGTAGRTLTVNAGSTLTGEAATSTIVIESGATLKFAGGYPHGEGRIINGGMLDGYGGGQGWTVETP